MTKQESNENISAKIVEISIEQLLKKLDSIVEDYDNGDNTHYRIVMDDGRAAMMVPHDGPYETTVKEFPDGELYVEIPQRLLSMQGWYQNTQLEMETQGNSIVITKKKIEYKQL
jgi:hypothetical protein